MIEVLYIDCGGGCMIVHTCQHQRTPDLQNGTFNEYRLWINKCDFNMTLQTTLQQ